MASVDFFLKNRIRKAIENFKNSLDSSTFDFLKLVFFGYIESQRKTLGCLFCSKAAAS
jgi:hypothetical protein